MPAGLRLPGPGMGLSDAEPTLLYVTLRSQYVSDSNYGACQTWHRARTVHDTERCCDIAEHAYRYGGDGDVCRHSAR